jgi:hypothetical protein
MEVVKRNMYSIICGVVAIIAVVLVFYPLGGWFEDLQGKLDTSEADYSSINSLLSKEHTAPDVDIDNAEQRKLGRFPTPKVIQAGEAAVQRVQDQSLKLLQRAMEMNRKAPLVTGALPRPSTNAILSQFRIEYYRKFDEFKQRLNATIPPLEEDVQKRVQQLQEEMNQNAGFVGGEFARNDMEFERQQRELTIPREMASEKAMRGSIYISPNPGGTGLGGGAGAQGELRELFALASFDVHHPGIPTPSQYGLTEPNIVDVWSAQLSLWIQEEIVDAIVKTNGNAQGVPSAVVKRLLEVKVPKEYVTKEGRLALSDPTSGIAIRQDANQFMNPGMVDPAAEDAGMATVEDPNKPPKDPKASATGRVCNTLYDVLHFTVLVDIDAARFREFMAHLVSNRHITILSVDMEGVDRDVELQSWFVYGDQPVVRLKLTCEALMFREWTLPLMPEDVKKALKITPPGAEDGTMPLAMP